MEGCGSRAGSVCAVGVASRRKKAKAAGAVVGSQTGGSVV